MREAPLTMMKENSATVSAGEILRCEYLQPMGISMSAMARAIGVAPRTISEIARGKRAITPAMSIRLGAFFGQSDEFWHGVQSECDFRALHRDKKRLVTAVQPAARLAAAQQ